MNLVLSLAVLSLSGQQAQPLPACPEGPLFQVIPMGASDYVAFRPLGFLTLPIHFFPAKHSSFVLALPGEPTPVREVRFPGQVWVVDILSTKFSSGNTGYQVQFQPCDKVRSYLYHLRDISPSLLDVFEQAEKRCFEQSFADGSTVLKCQARVFHEVAAGDLAGYTGDGTSGIDFGLVDFRLDPKGFADLANYPFDYPYYASPIDYYPPELQAEFEAKLASWDGKVKREAEPKAGSYRIDIVGTAQGGWFFPGSNMRSNPDDMTPHLALVSDYIDPRQPVIAMGIKVSGAAMGLYSFTPAESGDVNRPFHEVTPGNIHCYEGMRAGRSVGQLPLRSLPGVLLISLADETTLIVDRQGDSAASCESLRPWRLSELATTFQR
ncbi:MAG: hypothetical protein HY820_33650 [Acidobacteria bacterium]|nr:hypothetical protein [Acidobacteriota bacterium]